MKRRLADAAPAAAMAPAAAAPAAAAPADAQQAHDAQPPAGAVVVAPEQYEEQLAAKVARVTGLFSGFDLPAIEVHRSAPEHYRQRAEFRCGAGAQGGGARPPARCGACTVHGPRVRRCAAAAALQLRTRPARPRAPHPPTPHHPTPTTFRVWHQDGACHYIMFAKPPGAKEPRRYRVDTFPVGSRLMNALMAAVMAAANSNDALRRKLYQVNIHTTLAGQAMVTLIYHRQLGEEWAVDAAALRGALQEAASACLAEGRGGAAGGAGSEECGGGADAGAGGGQGQAGSSGGDEGCAGAAPSSSGCGVDAGSSSGGASGAPVVHVIGRSHKQKVTLDADYVTERLLVNGRELVYR